MADDMHDKSEDIGAKKHAMQIASALNLMKNPEATMDELGIEPEHIEKWVKAIYDMLDKAVAVMAGINPERRAQLLAGAKQQQKRLDKYLKSNFMQAYQALKPLESRNESPPKEEAVLYFFATREGLNPSASANLTQDDIQELRGIFYRLDKYYADQEKEDDNAELFSAFIAQENPDEAHIILQKGYYLLAQSHSSNALSKKLTERISDPAQLDLYGNASITEKDFRLFVKGYKELVNGVNQSAAMLLDSLMITATENGLKDTLVKLPLKQYMEMRELLDEKEIRKQIKRDIDALERISFEYKGTGKQRGTWLKVSIAGGTVGQVKNGDIIFRFNQDFFDSFKVGEGSRYLYMYFPREALQGNIRANPWKYWFARKISEHKRMNIGKPNEDVISVQTLISACPNFPTYESVTSGNRNITARIIEPFERDLDALSPTLSWEYQGLDESPKSYQDFITANIVVHWSAYPAIPHIEAGKKKRSIRQQARKEKSN